MLKCTYVLYKKKQKKKLGLASLGKFISSGTELSPSLSLSLFPFSDQPGEGKKKGGGGNFDRLPGNRLVGSRP